MKKILVMSDSHSSLWLMRLAIEKIKPDAMIHLGDHYDDGVAMAQAYAHIPMHQVVGNCDRYRCSADAPDLLCYDIFGARIFMAHGHCQGVKTNYWKLAQQARQMGAKAALFGHTHTSLCTNLSDGMWLLNPGSCGSMGGSVGLICVENGEILRCTLLNADELRL